MALEDTVIARPEKIEALYKRNPIKYLKVLEELNLMPLTVKILCSDPGKALLHFASWVNFSGGLHSVKYRPHISQRVDLLEVLKSEKLAALEQEYKLSDSGNRSYLELKTNSGIFGRMVYCMGIPLPNGTNRSTKPYYAKDLPYFIKDIMNSKPSEDEINERKNLLTIIARVLFKDRFKKHTGEWKKDNYYLQLNRHKTRKQARSYGTQIVDFLNETFRKGNNQDVFDYDAISVFKKKKKGLFRCELRLSDDNVGYLITKEPHILETNAVY